MLRLIRVRDDQTRGATIVDQPNRVWPAPVLVPMLVVDVRKMRVRVPHWAMGVRMDMRLLASPGKAMNMPMKRIMDVRVRMFHAFMRMTVLMAFRHMQPYAPRHQSAGDEQGWRDWLVLQPNRHGSAKKGRNRKICPRPSGTERAQSKDKEHEAYTIAGESDQGGSRR